MTRMRPLDFTPEQLLAANVVRFRRIADPDPDDGPPAGVLIERDPAGQWQAHPADRDDLRRIEGRPTVTARV